MPPPATPGSAAVGAGARAVHHSLQGGYHRLCAWEVPLTSVPAVCALPPHPFLPLPAPPSLGSNRWPTTPSASSCPCQVPRARAAPGSPFLTSRASGLAHRDGRALPVPGPGASRCWRHRAGASWSCPWLCLTKRPSLSRVPQQAALLPMAGSQPAHLQPRQRDSSSPCALQAA